MKEHPATFFTTGLVLGIIGLLDSIYLLFVKLANNPDLCIKGFGDCWAVNNSKYSEINGIPVSVFGILGYATIIAVLLAYKYIPSLNSLALYAMFGITLLGFLFGIYLIYIQFAVLDTYCPFCLVSEITMTLLLGLSIWKLSSAFKKF